MKLRVVVLGYVVRGPIGGMAWHHLQYVLGLARLGHDAWFVEDSDDYPGCYDPVRHVVDTDPSYGLAFAERAFRRLGLAERWAYHDAHAGGWKGPAADRAPEVCRSADLVLNLSAVNPLRPWLAEVPRRALVDTDPVFTQLRHLHDAEARRAAALHTHFFTFGEGMARGGACVPDDGFPWCPTRQPIVLDAWPVTPGPADGRFTTVMQWDSYPPREHAGRRYGMKSDSFAAYLDLPARTGAALELALGSESAPRDQLRAHGWTLRDPLAVTRDPWTYQQYLRESKAEFSVAKHGYVAARSGWFSERTAAYLASGRPTLVQDTGFSAWLPVGAGLLAFSSPDEAAAGVEEIDRRYAFHCRAAREVAERCFDSRAVLEELLEGIG
ncbi:MAG TPA: hypothetical protein VFX98_09555 [Longimicrobiaceae bacterium]|nr:hypothetical protein [Longimicrobiaceae bacterium]